MSFDSKKDFEIDSTNIKDRFYLDALGNKSINDNANDVYNIACDNKIGMISKQIKLLEYGKETLNDIKKYIEGNAFVKNQKIIKNKRRYKL